MIFSTTISLVPERLWAQDIAVDGRKKMEVFVLDGMQVNGNGGPVLVLSKQKDKEKVI